MTMNIRIEQVCAPAYPDPPRIRVQAQERHGEIWVSSGDAIYLTGPFALTDSLMLNDSRRYIISEVSSAN